MKKIIARVMVFCMTVTIPFLTGDLLEASAHDKEKVTIGDKIENEIKNDTTDVPENIERKLNAYGISDENIEHIPDKVIDNLVENNGNGIIDVRYYGSKSSDEQDEENYYEFQQRLEESEDELVEEVYETQCLVPLTEEEVNEIFDFSESTEDEKHISMGSLFCQNVYADGMTDQTEDTYDGLVQVCIMITYGKTLSNGLKTVSVYECAEWLKRPKYTGEDVIGITFPEGVLVDKETLGREYRYQYKDHSNPGIFQYFDYKADTSKLPVKYNNCAVAMTADLADDTSSAVAQNHFLAIWVEGIVSNKGTKCVNATGHYFHKVKKISNKTTVVLGVNQGGGYINVYNSTACDSVLHEVPNNPMCLLRFK